MLEGRGHGGIAGERHGTGAGAAASTAAPPEECGAIAGGAGRERDRRPAIEACGADVAA